MSKRTGIFLLLSFLIIVIAALMATAWQREPRSQKATTAIPLPAPPAVDPWQLDTLLPPDSIRVIDDPRFESADQVQDMELDEKIIGVEINGDTRSYPLTILSTHEIVNDVVGGQPVAITWCPLCYSALVFSRDVDDQTLSFAVSGKLLNNTLVMFDRNTGSLWSQLYGGAIDGQLSGIALAVYPSVLSTWEAWLAQNPEGQVLSKQLTCSQFDCGTYATNPRGSYAVDPYGSYYVSSDEGVVNRQIPRDEFDARPKERVLGVRVADVARAYPFAILSDQQVINDEIAGVPVLIWFDPRSQSAAAFKREVNGRTLTFETDKDDPTFVRDIESGSRWAGLSGHSHDGSYRQSQLSPLISTPAFEFGWYGYFPNSDTYGRSS